MKKILMTIIMVHFFAQLAFAQVELGVNFGAPAFFNAALGYWHGPYLARISGMYMGETANGLQFNLGYKFVDDGKVTRTLGIAVASSQDAGCDWSYVGPFYDYTNENFFLEMGLAFPTEVRRGDFSNIPVWPIFQIGYRWL